MTIGVSPAVFRFAFSAASSLVLSRFHRAIAAASCDLAFAAFAT